ncbi:MAG TPA: hypothetical protein VFH63_05090 [candidate division Zixibacteria bacterium]|nr:hypothetical protein [candidate division Zixibacteria bacterium]
MSAVRSRPAVVASPALALVAGLMLAACSSASPSATVPEPTPTAPAETPTAPPPSVDPSQPASDAPSAEPIPPDELGEFACQLPVTGVGNVALAHLTDVRVGEHDGFDRVVLEYEEGIPRFTLQLAQPPFTEDASGLPLEVAGSVFWSLQLQGGTKQGEDGTATYEGPTEFEPGFTKLSSLVEGGDFEAQSTWYLGLASDACVRVTTLPNPNRLVIDIEH